MSYPWSTAQIAAVGRLADYNGNAYNATTNPKGLAQGGHRTNFAPSLNDTSTAAGAVKDAADYAGAKADAAASSASDAATSAAKLSGTSTTAVAISAGSKSFTTQAGKFFDVGRTLRIVSAANPNTAYMVGKVTAYSGTTLTVAVQIFVGSGSPADWLIYVDGELGPSGTLTFTGATSLAPDQAPTVSNSGTASAAAVQLGIPRGMPAGLFFKWSTNTAATDPTAGRVKVGSASLTTATALYISETDANTVAQSAVIASWDDSTNPTRGQLRIEDIANPANFVVYDITGNLTDNGPWNTLPISYVDKGGTLADGASVRLEYRATGNVGTPGAAGSNGTAATLTFRTITTLAAGQMATFTNVGTTNAAVIDIGLPRGDKGDIGPVVAIRYNFDTAITDSDPGNGLIRFNSATTSSVTQIFIDNVEVLAGVSMTAWIDAFGTSTNPSSKGSLTIKDVNDPTKQVIFRITGSTVVDASMGYRKVPVQYVSGNGGFTAGANLGIVFARSGDKGSDGGGAGDVVGPSSATDGGFALFSGTTGKLLQSSSQAPGSLAYRSSINNTDWNGAPLSVGNGGTGAPSVSGAQTNLNLVPGTHVLAYSAKVQALADLAWAANKGVYFTSASAIATYDLTSFGRLLSAAADAAAAQTTLQLRPNVDILATTGGTLTGPLVLSGDPTIALHPATKQYVDALKAGMDPKDSARAASTPAQGNLTLSGTQTVDNVALAVGDRVLVKNQTTTSQNGIYVVASGAWTRSTDADAWNKLVDAFLFIEEGDANADTAWVCQSNQGGALGSTAVTFAQFGNTVIPNDSINNTKLADMPAGTIKGNNAASAGDPVDLTGAQATALLSPVVGDTGTGGTKGLVPAAAAGDAAAGRVLRADGTFGAAGALVDGIVTFAKLAAAALASAADLWSNTASKLVSVAALWAAESPVALGSQSGTVTLDFNTLRRATLTASASITLANPTNAKPGQTGSTLITMGAANLTISYGTAWKPYGGTTPTAPTTSGALCLLSWEVYATGQIVYSLGNVGA